MLTRNRNIRSANTITVLFYFIIFLTVLDNTKATPGRVFYSKGSVSYEYRIPETKSSNGEIGSVYPEEVVLADAKRNADSIETTKDSAGLTTFDSTLSESKLTLRNVYERNQEDYEKSNDQTENKQLRNERPKKMTYTKPRRMLSNCRNLRWPYVTSSDKEIPCITEREHKRQLDNNERDSVNEGPRLLPRPKSPAAGIPPPRPRFNIVEPPGFEENFIQGVDENKVPAPGVSANKEIYQAPVVPQLGNEEPYQAPVISQISSEEPYRAPVFPQYTYESYIVPGLPRTKVNEEPYRVLAFPQKSNEESYQVSNFPQKVNEEFYQAPSQQQKLPESRNSKPNINSASPPIQYGPRSYAPAIYGPPSAPVHKPQVYQHPFQFQPILSHPNKHFSSSFNSGQPNEHSIIQPQQSSKPLQIMTLRDFSSILKGKEFNNTLNNLSKQLEIYKQILQGLIVRLNGRNNVGIPNQSTYLPLPPQLNSTPQIWSPSLVPIRKQENDFLFNNPQFAKEFKEEDHNFKYFQPNGQTQSGFPIPQGSQKASYSVTSNLFSLTPAQQLNSYANSLNNAQVRARNAFANAQSQFLGNHHQTQHYYTKRQNYKTEKESTSDLSSIRNQQILEQNSQIPLSIDDNQSLQAGKIETTQISQDIPQLDLNNNSSPQEKLSDGSYQLPTTTTDGEQLSIPQLLPQAKLISQYTQLPVNSNYKPDLSSNSDVLKTFDERIYTETGKTQSSPYFNQVSIIPSKSSNYDTSQQNQLANINNKELNYPSDLTPTNYDLSPSKDIPNLNPDVNQPIFSQEYSVTRSSSSYSQPSIDSNLNNNSNPDFSSLSIAGFNEGRPLNPFLLDLNGNNQPRRFTNDFTNYNYAPHQSNPSSSSIPNGSLNLDVQQQSSGVGGSSIPSSNLSGNQNSPPTTFGTTLGLDCDTLNCLPLSPLKGSSNFPPNLFPQVFNNYPQPEQSYGSPTNQNFPTEEVSQVNPTQGPQQNIPSYGQPLHQTQEFRIYDNQPEVSSEDLNYNLYSTNTHNGPHHQQEEEDSYHGIIGTSLSDSNYEHEDPSYPNPSIEPKFGILDGGHHENDRHYKMDSRTQHTDSLNHKSNGWHSTYYTSQNGQQPLSGLELGAPPEENSDTSTSTPASTKGDNNWTFDPAAVSLPLTYTGQSNNLSSNFQVQY